MTEECEVCGGDVRHTTTDFVVRQDGEVIVVENVPAWVCEVCGEKAFDAGVVQRLQETIREKKGPARTEQAQVFDFAAV